MKISPREEMLAHMKALFDGRHPDEPEARKSLLAFLAQDEHTMCVTEPDGTTHVITPEEARQYLQARGSVQ